MALRKIVLMGHPALRRIADAVDRPDAHDIRALTADMKETLESINSNGLAAPQVEDGRRVVVYRLPTHRIPKGARQEPVPWTAMVNPILEPLSDKVLPIWERCLSLPGLYGKVPRFNNIRLSYADLDGVRQERIATGYHAMLVQHECDHLDGILYPMRLHDLTRLTFASELGDGASFYNYSVAEFDGT